MTIRHYFKKLPKSTKIMLSILGGVIVVGCLSLFIAGLVVKFQASVPAPPPEIINQAKLTYRDSQGNPQNVQSDILKIIYPNDTIPPIGTITINNGNSYTNLSHVNINIDVTDDLSGVDLMRFSNNATTWTDWMPFLNSYTWDITASSYGGTDSEGLKNVYSQFKDKDGNASLAITDSITYDKTSPTGGIIINQNGSYATNNLVSLTINANDNISGVSQIRLSNDNAKWSNWLTLSNTMPWDLVDGQYGGTSSEGRKTVFLQIKDSAGNLSPSYSDSIIYDKTGPSNIFTINKKAGYTKSSNVVLNIKAADTISGVSAMRFSNNNNLWSAWTSYKTIYSWNLAVAKFGGKVSEGRKIVYAEFRDSAGNLSTISNNSIIYDKTPPIGNFNINHLAKKTRSHIVYLYLIATDRISGLRYYRVSNNNKKWTSWKLYTTKAKWDITSTKYGGKTKKGNKYVYVMWQDRAGNNSKVKVAKIKLR